MKSTPSFPPQRRVSRRHFLTGTTASLAASLAIPSMGFAGQGRGQGEGPAVTSHAAPPR